MAKAKTVHGTRRTWHKHFFVFALDFNNGVVLVACETKEDAEEEKNRLKQSTGTKRVSYTTRKVSEMELRVAIKKNGWKLLVVRECGKITPAIDEFEEMVECNLDEVMAA